MNTKKRIKLFKKTINEAVDLFGLHGFQFSVMEQIKDGARASNYYHSIESDSDSDARMFTICYSLSWVNSKHTKRKDIITTAYHEVFECMFYRLRDFSRNTEFTISKREIDSEIHRIVRVFENRVLPHLLKEG